jgi:hypothetical protein
MSVVHAWTLLTDLFSQPTVMSIGETDVVWQFSQPGALSKWVITSDSDHSEGHSTCELSLSKGGKGLFMGTLNTQVPKDGRIKKAGYCNMRSMRPRVNCWNRFLCDIS